VHICGDMRRGGGGRGRFAFCGRVCAHGCSMDQVWIKYGCLLLCSHVSPSSTVNYRLSEVCQLLYLFSYLCSSGMVCVCVMCALPDVCVCVCVCLCVFVCASYIFTHTNTHVWQRFHLPSSSMALSDVCQSLYVYLCLLCYVCFLCKCDS
jgi:hypothetical protein